MSGLQKICVNIRQLGITVCILLTTCLVPLYMHEGYNMLGTVKFLLYRNVTLALLPIIFLSCLCVRLLGGFRNPAGRIRVMSCHALNATDWLAAAYGGSVLLSFCLSDYKETAFWGANGWYMGLYSQMSFLCLYFLCAYAWLYEKEVLAAVLVTSGGIAFLAVLNRFAVYPVTFSGSSPTLLSTIGNINWLSGYLTLMLPLSLVLFWGSEKLIWRVWAGILLSVLIICCFVQGSESGYLTVAASFLGLLFLSLFCHDRNRIKKFGQAVLIAAGGFFVIALTNDCFRGRLTYENWFSAYYHIGYGAAVLLSSAVFYAVINVCLKYNKDLNKKRNTVLTVPIVLFIIVLGCGILIGREPFRSLLKFDDSWGNGRGIIWQTCFRLWKEEGAVIRLFGAGPDSFSAFAYERHSEEPLFAEVYKYSILTNCHSEWLTALLTLGLTGLITYSGFILASIRKFLGSKDLAVTAVGLSVFVYTLHNMVSFQQITSTPLLFVLMGIAVNRHRKTASGT